MLKKSSLQIVLVTLLMQGCSLVSNIGSYHSDKPVVMFILDTSNSMNEQDSGQRRIDKAKESIINTVSQLDRNRYNAALITFRGGSRRRGCRVKLAVKPSGHLDEIVNITKSIEASGKTPLADAIKLSGKVLKNVEDKMVILLTDGKETCRGRPVAEAKKLYEKYGININFQVIGYAVDDSTRKELKKISRISKKWNYHDAKDSIHLEKAIDNIMTEHGMRDSSWVNANEFVFEFSTGSIQLNEKYVSEIKKMYNYLKNNDKHIEIIGHTDSIGSKTSNHKLSKKRANAVQSELIRLGINANRITTKGKGEDNPIANNNTEEGRKQNRRVEILIR